MQTVPCFWATPPQRRAAGVQHSGTTSRSSSVPFAGGYGVDNKQRMHVFDCGGQEEGWAGVDCSTRGTSMLMQSEHAKT